MKKKKRIVEEERYQKELAIIAQEDSLLRAVEDEQKKVEIEQNRIIRTDFINGKMSNAFGTKTKIDSAPIRQLAIDNILPKAFVPEQAYPEPFEEEPLLNKELADFKKKINEHLHKMEFGSGSGGGEVRLEFLDDIDKDSAKIDGMFLQYQVATNKWIGTEGGDIVIQYSKEVDFVDASDLIYVGEALPGSTTASASWRIKKIDLNAGTDSDIGIRYADGDSTFDNIWDNHLSLTYS